MNVKSEFEDFKRSVKSASSKIAAISLSTLQENVKAHSRGGNYYHHTKPPFCKAVFACEFRVYKVVRGKRGGKRRYQMCSFQDTCNQQVGTAMYLQLEEPRR